MMLEYQGQEVHPKTTSIGTVSNCCILMLTCFASLRLSFLTVDNTCQITRLDWGPLSSNMLKWFRRSLIWITDPEYWELLSADVILEAARWSVSLEASNAAGWTRTHNIRIILSAVIEFEFIASFSSSVRGFHKISIGAIRPYGNFSSSYKCVSQILLPEEYLRQSERLYTVI